MLLHWQAIWNIFHNFPWLCEETMFPDFYLTILRSKVILGYPKWPPSAHFVKTLFFKLCIDLKWREMRSKVIFQTGHRGVILWRKKIKVVYWSEMARNAIEGDFRSSKMAAEGHFVKKKSNNIKVAYLSEIARNAIKSDFQSSKMAAGSDENQYIVWSPRASMHMHSVSACCWSMSRPWPGTIGPAHPGRIAWDVRVCGLTRYWSLWPNHTWPRWIQIPYHNRTIHVHTLLGLQ